MKHKFLKHTRFLLVYLILALSLTLTLAVPVLAQEPLGDQVLFGNNLSLKAEQKVDGDVVIFGGSLDMANSSQVDGDVVIFGGNATVNGKVTGNMGMIGSNVNLGESAVVEGDIALVGSKLERAAGAVVNGKIEDISRFNFNFDEGGFTPPAPPTAPDAPKPPVSPIKPSWNHSDWDRDPAPSFFSRVVDFFEYVIGTILMLIGVTVVSWLVATFMPEQMKVTGDTLSESTLLSFGIGALTMIVAGVVGLVLAITICLAPVSFIAWLIIGVATLFGWIVIGQFVGERLIVASGRPYPNLVSSTVLGTLVLTVVATVPVLEKIPCLGFLLAFAGGLVGLAAAMAGLGAVILTRFGTRPYPLPGSSYGGGFGPTSGPRPAPGGSGQPQVTEALSALERSEAELRAKIKAALAEAEARPAPVVEEPVVEPPVTDTPVEEIKPVEETPSPAEPGPEPADGEPDKKPDA